MSTRLADRLSAARHRYFVGRNAEQALFHAAITAAELPFFVWYLYGPGGVGKTTLLQQFVLLSRQRDVGATYVDGRDLAPSPEGFLSALQRAMQLPESELPIETLLAGAARHVLLIDAVEHLTALDGWLRDTFLPQLPDNLLVVLSGRLPPSVDWRADPGWQTVIQTAQLRNLQPDESRSYLERRMLPIEHYQAILDFTHGHPLALSLVADTFAQRGSMTFQTQIAPDVIKLLLEEFVQHVPGPAHRAALEACALVHVTTETLLSELLGMPDVHSLFEWLRELSFIESGRAGLLPHDLAREALLADLRWRNPDWHAELRRRARTYYARSLRQQHGTEQQQLMFDFVFLHRENPMVRPFLEWQHTGASGPSRMLDDDRSALLAMVSRHEGQSSARLAAHWLELQPNSITVFRDVHGRPAGFLAAIELQAASDADRAVDPAVGAAWHYLEGNAPLRGAERATMFRFWMDRDSYQAVGAIQSRIFLTIGLYYLNTAALAYTFFVCSEPGFWTPALTYMDIERVGSLDVAVGGRRYGVFGHDWRVTPPLAWLELLAERETAAEPLEHQPPASAAVLVQGRDAFEAAVRLALQHYISPAVLRGNVLLRSRLLRERSGPQAGDAERAVELQRLLLQAVAQLQTSPRELKYYRAVYHTYIQPAATQELAAELLDVPFSSYRRHLRTGIAKVAETMWRWEMSGIDSDLSPLNQE